MLGDLGYRIPYGQTHDLLSQPARLDPSAVERSRLHGSIAQRLRQGVLMEMATVVLIQPPQISVAEPSAISFPQRVKSLVVSDEGDLTASVQSVVADEDAEFLKQMEEDEKTLAEGEVAGLPVTVDTTKAAAVLDKVSGSCCGGKGRK